MLLTGGVRVASIMLLSIKKICSSVNVCTMDTKHCPMANYHDCNHDRPFFCDIVHHDVVCVDITKAKVNENEPVSF